MNAASAFWRDGRQFPSSAQYDAAVALYERLEIAHGDNPNAIAAAAGWTGGTACVLRRMSRERRER